MNVLALDLSLTATGVAMPDGTTTRWSPKCRGAERLKVFRELVTDTLTDAAPMIDLVVIEEYAFSRAAAHSHEVGELGGVVRLALHDIGVAWVAVGPSSLKKYATGRGNAKKPELLAEAIRRLNFDGHDDNEVDALWLQAMALDHYGEPVVDMPALNREALVKVAWPEITTTEGARP